MFFENFSAKKRNLHSVVQVGSDHNASEELSTPTNDNVLLVQNAREHKRTFTIFSTINLKIMNYALNYSQYPYIGTLEMLISDLCVSDKSPGME